MAKPVEGPVRFTDDVYRDGARKRMELKDFQEMQSNLMANNCDGHESEWLDEDEEETLTIMEEIEFYNTFVKDM